MSTIPMYFPADFNRSDAIGCTDYVKIAINMYGQWVDQGKPNRDSFIWKPKVSGITFSQPIWGIDKIIVKISEPFGFAAWKDDGTAWLVFRGTRSISDWIVDSEYKQMRYSLVPDFGNVHEGFMNLYTTMSVDVRNCLKQAGSINRLFISGHSLGSALSTMAVPDVMSNDKMEAETITHYNCGCPRVGDTTFVNKYNKSGVPTYRIVNTCDLVPVLPFPEMPMLKLLKSNNNTEVYEHVGTPVDYTAQYGSVANNHNYDNSYIYALNHPDNPQNPDFP